jgi:AraC-like DNA-binding protein
MKTVADTLLAPGPALPHRADTEAAYTKAIERVIQHMKEHLDEPLDLEQLAWAAATSKFHFVRVFDQVTGTTPHHFLACLRVQRAKELLLSTDAPITDICLQVGYSSLGSFSRTFSSLVGVSPQEFRSLPRRLNPVQFGKAVWHFLASDQEVAPPLLQGEVQGPARPRGFTFVGAFTKGVPQGVPFSGTVLMKPGPFRIQNPALPEFHLLAAFIPLSANLTTIVTTLPIRLVASLRVQADNPDLNLQPRLRLRPLRPTDPPIVLALPALPPWRGVFTNAQVRAAEPLDP